MHFLVSGVCGFVGSMLARALREAGHAVSGFDNFIRPGSESNRLALRTAGVGVLHADVRSATDVEALPAADWLVDAAANASVLAGVDGRTSSRQLVEHNLFGTVNLLEYCKRHGAGFTLLSTSRVYSIAALARVPVVERGDAFAPDPAGVYPEGVSAQGISEAFSTEAPVSLYGATKLASEVMAMEYGEAFGFPVWVNRCGVMAGAGQFGRADQGIFAFWINAWLRGAPLKYIGFGGRGLQVRDALHPTDLVPVLLRQVSEGEGRGRPKTVNLAGGARQSMSLAGLSAWCAERFGPRAVEADDTRRLFDIPWMVLDASLAEREWGFRPERGLPAILEEIAAHAEANPGWLELSSP